MRKNWVSELEIGFSQKNFQDEKRGVLSSYLTYEVRHEFVMVLHKKLYRCGPCGGAKAEHCWEEVGQFEECGGPKRVSWEFLGVTPKHCSGFVLEVWGKILGETNPNWWLRA